MWELVSFMASMVTFGLLITVGYAAAAYLPKWLEKNLGQQPVNNQYVNNINLEKRIKLLESKITALQ